MSERKIFDNGFQGTKNLRFATERFDGLSGISALKPQSLEEKSLAGADLLKPNLNISTSKESTTEKK